MNLMKLMIKKTLMINMNLGYRRKYIVCVVYMLKKLLLI